MPRNQSEKLPTLGTIRIPPPGAPGKDIPLKIHKRMFWNYGWGRSYLKTELGAVARQQYQLVFDTFSSEEHEVYSDSPPGSANRELRQFYIMWWDRYIKTWKEVHGAA